VKGTIKDASKVSRWSDRHGHGQSTRRRERPHDLTADGRTCLVWYTPLVYMLHGIAFATHDTDKHIIYSNNS
jgi:hypothetical protein